MRRSRNPRRSGAMMDYPLTIQSIYDRARTLFPEKQIVSRRGPDVVARTTYGEWAERVARLAGALRELGVGKGDRVATFCWNHDRHLESYFAAALMGASYHTVNIRLGPDQLAYIVNHARDKVLVVDASLARAIAPIIGQLDSVEHVLLIDDGGQAPKLNAAAVHDYETVVEAANPMTNWPRLDEQDTAGICYTSATTGNPKGVAYSHRAIFLHTLMLGTVTTMAVAERDVLLPIVPMFHVNAWGMPFAAVWYGAVPVFGGPGNPVPADGKSMGELLLRGPTIAHEYLDDERSADTFVDGWYHTGDVATLDGEGYLQLVDRTKDLVKSGGEWISSVELENALMGHPAVAEAAVIAVPDAKWGERPLAVVVRKPGATVTEAELAASIAGKFPKWQLPDRFEFVDEIPKTATGKFSKRTLRERFAASLGDDDSDER